MQAGFLVFARVSHIDNVMFTGNLKNLKIVLEEAQYIHVLDSLGFPRLIV